MKRINVFLMAALSLLFCHSAFGQSATYDYIYPGLGDGTPYRYLRFGSSSTYWAGFMYNFNSNSYGNGDDFSIFTYGNRDIVLRAGTAGHVVLHPSTNSGNVGIATTSPNYKLDVNGTTRTKEIRVQTGWSDYVFLPDYQLPTLLAEEQHIITNGYLLGFESEAAMEGEVQLGDVTKRQQAKIEEMMLHLIELNKAVQAQNEEIERLKALVKPKKLRK